MKTEKNIVFLNKMLTKIKDGEFDDQLNLPFMSKELFYSAIKSKLLTKIETGGTPVLNDAEVKDVLLAVKETALQTSAIFIKNKIMVKGIDGWELSPVAIKALRSL